MSPFWRVGHSERGISPASVARTSVQHYIELLLVAQQLDTTTENAGHCGVSLNQQCIIWTTYHPAERNKEH